MCTRLLAIGLVLLTPLCAWSPASTQTPQGTSVGTLTCRMGPSIGLIFGSRQRMACRFTPNGGGQPGSYFGVMNFVGLGIGIIAGGALGCGANVLFGGPGRSIHLQPLSVEGSVGINLSLGVSGLTLTAAH